MNVVPRVHPHRRGLFALLGCLVVAGAYAALTLPRSIYPHVEFRRVVVIAQRGETSVQGMLTEVTRPLEQALAAVVGVHRLRSKTVRSQVEIAMDLDAGVDPREARADARARASAADLPGDVRLTIENQTPALFPVISFNVLPGEADVDRPVERARLAEWAELELKPRLARLNDVFLVTVESGDRREYVFEPDPEALARSGVGIEDVRDALERANVLSAVGRAERAGQLHQVLVDGRMLRPDDVLDTALPRPAGVPPLRLRDLGGLTETCAERTRVVAGGGRDGVVMSVFMRDAGRVTDLSHDVRAVLAEAAAKVPHGGRIVPVYDQAELVEESIAGVFEAIATGAVLAVLVLLLFLRDPRMTLIAGLSIPASVLLALAVFPLASESLNLMSLGGLAIAIGLVIDDTIVVVESVARHLDVSAAERPSFQETFLAVAAGTRDVVGAIVGSSFTTVVVFVPLMLLEGVVGQFFRSLSLALGASILASLVVALVFAPLLLLVPGLRPRRGKGAGGGRRWIGRLQERYARGLTALLRRPGFAAACLAMVLAAGALALRDVRTGFLPEMDEGGFVLDYALPVGTSLAQTDAVCREIEAVLRETPEVATFSRRTGSELGFFATQTFEGDMLVGLVPRARRERDVFAVLDGLRDELARRAPQADVAFVQVMQDTINDLAGNPDPIEVKVFGSDYALLQDLAERAATRIERVPGVVDVRRHVALGSPEVTWRVDPEGAARVGLDARRIADAMSAQLLGTVATTLQEGERRVDLRVRYPEVWRRRAEEEDAVLLGPLPGVPGAGFVPLASVAEARAERHENELEREDLTPMVRVTASVAGRDLGSVGRDVERAVADLGDVAGARVEVGGQLASQRGAFANLVAVFGVALALTVLLLVLQFKSFSLAFVLLLALPFGQVGALHALGFADLALDVSSAMGLILLVGLVVKNGIILVESAERLHRDGRPVRDAVVEAARIRLRPILMTTLASIAGLLPLAFGVGSGAALQRPLAVAVIGGLLVSTAATLLVVPLGCATFGARGFGRGGPAP